MKYKVYTDEVVKNKAGDVTRSYVKEQTVYGMDKVDKIAKQDNFLCWVAYPMYATSRR